MTAAAGKQNTADWGRMAARIISAPFIWIKARISRRALIAYPLALITLGYLATGLALMINEADWRISDTYFMITGFAVFAIGTIFALVHEISLKRIGGEIHRLSPRLAGLPADSREVATPSISTVDMQQHDEIAIDAPPRAASIASASSMGDIVELAKLEDPPPIDLAWKSLGLLETPDEKQNALQRFALESAIEVRAGKTAVRDLLRRTEVFALGSAVGDTESDILHFTIDDAHGKERVLMPLFTRFDVLRGALLRNPDWTEQAVLQVNGGDLIDRRDSDVTLVINPWSRLEWQVYPS